ncbi:hypothetical protein [Actinomyces sp. ZJ308]|uniref:hypothetical protein n=1 Tax=Actinomyces sp. ZJ308 TaxID=2708342 RepID=UPI001422338D|nr:hypothetical protein [Actinomyces sp. ZJ308]
MKSSAGIDYVDVSPGEDAGGVDAADAESSKDDGTVEASAASEVAAESPVLVSADVHAVMLGLWASGLRCVIVYALAPAIGAAGPLAVGTALVIQVAGTAVSLSGARSLWMRRYRGRYVYVLIAGLSCLCTLAALLAPTGF